MSDKIKRLEEIKALHIEKAEVEAKISAELARIEALDKMIKATETLIKNENDSDFQEVIGNTMFEFKISTRNTLDTTKIKNEEPAIYNTYLKQSQIKKLTIKDLKGMEE